MKFKKYLLPTFLAILVVVLAIICYQIYQQKSLAKGELSTDYPGVTKINLDDYPTLELGDGEEAHEDDIQTEESQTEETQEN